MGINFKIVLAKSPIEPQNGPKGKTDRELKAKEKGKGDNPCFCRQRKRSERNAKAQKTREDSNEVEKYPRTRKQLERGRR